MSELNEVEELKKQLEAKEIELTEKEAKAKEASEEVELTLLQLHQLQEELLALFISKKKVENKLKKLRKHLEQGSASLIKNDKEAKANSEKSELTLVQLLRNIQKEREYYFLLSRRQAEMLSSSEKLSERGAALIAKMMQ